MQEILVKYGLAGVGLAALSWFVLFLMKSHKEERKEWKKTIEDQFKEHNQVMRDNTSILSGLKTLLENKK